MPTLYVNNATGDDSRTYAQAQNEATPWLTVGRAAWGSTDRAAPNASEAVQAGDTVLIAAGTYWENGAVSGGRFTVSLNPVNNGTSGNPITFRGVGDVYLRQNNTYRGSIIGSEGRSYIIWDNLIIDDTYCGSTSDTGPVGFYGNAQYCQLINSTVTGHNGSYYWGYATFDGNYRLVAFENGHNCTIKNNRISRALRADGSAGGQNEGGILAYDSTNNIFEHNEISECGAGIFVKGAHSANSQRDNIVRYNYIHDCFSGIRIIANDDGLVYRNIVANGVGASNMGLWIGFSDALRSKWVNNTVYNCDRGIVLQDNANLVDVEVYNNIVAGCTYGVYNWPSADPSVPDVILNHNFYFNNSTHAYWEAIGAITFATWQGTYSKDPNGSNAVDPQFVSPSTGDWRLGATSPARTAGIDYLDFDGDSNTSEIIAVGAYVTGLEEIGIESGSGGGGGGGGGETPVTYNLGPVFLL